MIKGGLFPIARIMAARALSVEVVGRLVFSMAVYAVSGAKRFVVEAGLRPGSGVMTE